MNCSVACTYTVLSFSESKMTLAELKSVVETMQNLPCVMTQLEEVQVRGSVTEQQTCSFSDFRHFLIIFCAVVVYFFAI